MSNVISLISKKKPPKEKPKPHSKWPFNRLPEYVLGPGVPVELGFERVLAAARKPKQKRD